MIDHLTRTQRLGAAALALLGLAGLGYIGQGATRRSPPIVVQPSAESPKAASPSSTATASPEPGSEVIVHVVGAVKTAGVQRMKSGARVLDAIHAAGGPTADADLESINLAAKLTDGTQLLVPRKRSGTTPTSIAPPYRGGANAPSTYDLQPLPVPLTGPLTKVEIKPMRDHSTGTKPTPQPVSLNTGTLEQLQTLPGIGPSTAQKIVQYRQEHGGFSSPEEILSVKGIGPKKFEKMRPWLRP